MVEASNISQLSRECSEDCIGAKTVFRTSQVSVFSLLIAVLDNLPAAKHVVEMVQMFILRTRPKTHVGVARRMVEGALGMKANVSQEKKQAERKELNDARG